EVAYDLISNAIRYVREGNPESGYVVRAVLPGGTDASQNLAFFIDKDNGAWRILGAGGEYPGVAQRVLALADAGNLALARTWLDRVRKDVHAGGGDDVLSGPPFAHLWEQGQEGSVDQIRAAAAALLAESSDSGNAAVPILERTMK